jgi:hypothetical protein
MRPRKKRPEHAPADGTATLPQTGPRHVRLAAVAEYKLSLVALASIIAKTLGLKVPHTLLARADKMIE